MLNVFIGYDHRQPISSNVLQFSILQRCSQPVAITHIKLDTVPTKRTGLTPFTFSRYLVPWLMGYQGRALFLDADILVLGDIAELFALPVQDMAAVSVVKNVRQFEWASVMLFECGHPLNKAMTPEWLNAAPTDAGDPNAFINNPFKFSWLQGGAKSTMIGALPSEWNHLVGYDTPRNDAKIVHYTMGIPIFSETQSSEYAEAYRNEAQMMNGSISWIQLMGQSVHAAHLPDGRVLPWLHPDVKGATAKQAG